MRAPSTTPPIAVEYPVPAAIFFKFAIRKEYLPSPAATAPSVLVFCFGIMYILFLTIYVVRKLIKDCLKV
jgi:predicted permease